MWRIRGDLVMHCFYGVGERNRFVKKTEVLSDGSAKGRVLVPSYPFKQSKLLINELRKSNELTFNGFREIIEAKSYFWKAGVRGI
jgi:hypothetical protein